MKKPIHALPVHQLALRVVDIAQIFNSMDPTPFFNKDIDPEAEAYIESWAAGFVSNSRFHIIVHSEQWPTDGDPTVLLTGAIHNHFSFKAERARDVETFSTARSYKSCYWICICFALPHCCRSHCKPWYKYWPHHCT